MSTGSGRRPKTKQAGKRLRPREIRLRRTGSPTRRRIYTTFRTWPARLQAADCCPKSSIPESSQRSAPQGGRPGKREASGTLTSRLPSVLAPNDPSLLLPLSRWFQSSSPRCLLRDDVPLRSKKQTTDDFKSKQAYATTPPRGRRQK